MLAEMTEANEKCTTKRFINVNIAFIIQKSLEHRILSIFTFIYVCVFMYIYVCVCVYIYIYIYVCVYVYIYIYIRMCVYMYIYIYIYVCEGSRKNIIQIGEYIMI